MATQENKEREHPQADPASPRNTTKDPGVKPDETTDPDLYDPVGMAGKKAGIVQQLEQEPGQQAPDVRPDPGTKPPVRTPRIGGDAEKT